MLIESFLHLLLLRVIICVIAAFTISMVLAVCFSFLGDKLRFFIQEQVLFRWTGTVVYFIVYIAMCTSIDYLTGLRDEFAGVPAPLRLIGCTALALWFTIVAGVLRKPAQEHQQHPDWGTFSTAPHEPFNTAPLQMAEFLCNSLKRH